MAQNSMIAGLYEDYMRSQPKAQTYKPAQAQATPWTVDKDQTVQGQLGGMLSKSSPLWKQAETRGMQAAAKRGMMNSSMGAQAAQSALMDVAVPIATSDATTYGRAAETNAVQGSETARYNAGEANKAGMLGAEWQNRFTEGDRRLGGDLMLQRGQQEFQTTENQAEREFRRGERIGSQEFESGEAGKGREFTAGENRLTREFTSAENRLGRQFTTEERLAGEQYASGENKIGREFTRAERMAGEEFIARQTVTAHSNRLAEMGFANDLAKAQVPVTYAANMSQSISAAVAAIMANGDLTPEAKRGAISNYIDFANNTLKWAEVMFATDMPDFLDPSNP